MPELPEDRYRDLAPEGVPFERLYMQGQYNALCGVAVALYRLYPHMHEMHAMLRERVEDVYALLKYLQIGTLTSKRIRRCIAWNI